MFDPAHIPLFLYPFLNTTSKTRAFEYLRLTSLGVIGAFVKVKISFISSKSVQQRNTHNLFRMARMTMLK